MFHHLPCGSNVPMTEVKVDFFAEAGCPFCREAVAGPVGHSETLNTTLQPASWCHTQLTPRKASRFMARSTRPCQHPAWRLSWTQLTHCLRLCSDSIGTTPPCPPSLCRAVCLSEEDFEFFPFGNAYFVTSECKGAGEYETWSALCQLEAKLLRWFQAPVQVPADSLARILAPHLLLFLLLTSSALLIFTCIHLYSCVFMCIHLYSLEFTSIYLHSLVFIYIQPRSAICLRAQDMTARKCFNKKCGAGASQPAQDALIILGCHRAFDKPMRSHAS